jgi:hypothetical protein
MDPNSRAFYDPEPHREFSILDENGTIEEFLYRCHVFSYYWVELAPLAADGNELDNMVYTKMLEEAPESREELCKYADEADVYEISLDYISEKGTITPKKVHEFVGHILLRMDGNQKMKSVDYASTRLHWDAEKEDFIVLPVSI